MKFLKLLTAVVWTAVSVSAWADVRIRQETYSTNKVYPIYAQNGKAVLIQLEDGERVAADADNTIIGVGDAAAWKMGVRGNNIVFKPQAEQPVTNMLVVSNRRTYAFDLLMADNTHSPTYILRFSYPDTEEKQRQEVYKKQGKALQVLTAQVGEKSTQQPERNENYWAYGNKELTPTSVYDNGRFTFFQFNNGRELPAIYRAESDGSESLLNTHIDGDTVVVHETAAKFMLRTSREVLAVENRAYQADGKFNRTGTDDNQSVRLIKE